MRLWELIGMFLSHVFDRLKNGLKILWRDRLLLEKDEFKFLKNAELLNLDEAEKMRLCGMEKRKPYMEWNTAMFFPRDNIERLVSYIRKARTNIKICMYLASSRVLEKVIFDKWEEGLVIMVVTEYDTIKVHNNQTIKCWASKGIPVVYKPEKFFLLHNKYIIIDNEAVITGSANWTRQAFTLNHENLIVTTHPRIVKPFIQHFSNVYIHLERH